MLNAELAESARTLVTSRGRTLGGDLTVLARRYANWSSQELSDALSDAPREDKPAIGLLLARVALEDALAAKSRNSLSKFLFRFGAHLKVSVSAQGLTPSQRLALALAAERVFDAMPDASANQRSEVHGMRIRLSGPVVSERDWGTTVGLPEEEFGRVIDQVSAVLGGSARMRGQREVVSRSPARRISRKTTFSEAATHTPPGWLTLNFSGSPDLHVIAAANWSILASGPASADVPIAWSAFKQGRYAAARDHLQAILNGIGTEWGPSNGVDDLRNWNWLRLVTELASIQNGTALDARRSWTSAASLAHKCLPDDAELVEQLISRALDDFAAGDLTSQRAWAAYTARLATEVGHETALADYSNQQKAKLRSVWSSQFALKAEEGRSTAAMVSSFAPRLRAVTQKLYLGALGGSSPDRTLRETARDFSVFLDLRESELLGEIVETIEDAHRRLDKDSLNHRDLLELRDGLRTALGSIATCGSALLQDFVAPLVQAAIATTEHAIERLGDMSRPQVAIRLASQKVPFSATPGSTYQLRFIVRNTGNAAAENLTVRVVQEELDLDSTGGFESLGPGAEAEVRVHAVANGSSVSATTLRCDVEWTDSLLQHFSATELIPAENQGPVSWTTTDENPFSLGTISDPRRLVGRDEDLLSLDTLIAGRASAYITGHKRVGKTSLTRVLLKSISRDRSWAGSLLALGRALGQDQSASDIVYALLDEILGAAGDAYPDSVRGMTEVVIDDTRNFARAANRWLKSMARALPDDARVVIAIDDFDELPAHLVEGPQADALFLFLRSLVDEPWLNLIMVGSEVLPSIIQKQAHKLNQVVPVSVTNFASRESTASLLVTPTRDRLEWGAEAIDRVHYLCRGNPYYETLVAQRLWLSMRERSRSIVTSGDVDEAAHAVARDAPESHFIHLWADSSTGLDHTSRPAVVASAILRSIARCGGEQLAPASTDEVVRVAGTWIQTATSEELQRAVATLRARDVVQAGPSEGSLLISIPLVGVWLLGGGGRALDGIYSTSKHATATVRMVTDSDLVSLSRQLTYRGEHVTEIRIKAWLNQFGDHYHQYLAFRMLRRMIMDGYFTSTKLQTTVLPRLAGSVHDLGAARHLVREANNQYLRNGFLIDHGVAGDSTQGTLSALAKVLRIKKANIVSLETIGEKVRNIDSAVLFLLDDYSGTGTHLTRTLDGLMDSLEGLGSDRHDDFHIVVGAGVVADKADLPKPETRYSVEHVAGTYLSNRYRPFSDDSGVFSTDKERRDAEEMSASIGRALLRNNPLGFGGRALLTLLEFNCPNNVAPMFWRGGHVSGEPWVPLFERAV